MTERRYANRHAYQYDVRNTATTRRSGCTWISGRDGADASSGGIRDVTPDHVHDLVLPKEESNPLTPGWSMPDLVLAMRRLRVPFEDRTGAGWASVLRDSDAGLYVVLQGDSEVFTGGCSGEFDGDHAIGMHPQRELVTGRQRIDDPICRTARYEHRTVLRTYAERLHRSIRYGVFMMPVPFMEEAPMEELRGAGGALRTFEPGTDYFDEPGGAKRGEIEDTHTVYRVVAYVTRGTVRWGLLDGAGQDDPLRWVILD